MPTSRVSPHPCPPPLPSISNLADDGSKLFRDFGICARNLVELGALARHVDPSFAATYNRAIVGLANVVAHYAGKSLKKGKERMGNWEGELGEKMIECQFSYFFLRELY